MRKLIQKPPAPQAEEPQEERAPRPSARSAEEPGAVRIPHDPVNEQILLSAAVVSGEARKRLVKLLPPDRFQVREHVDAWLMFAEMDRLGLEFDVATVHQLSGGKVDAQYLLDLARDRDEVPSNLDHHVSMLEWDAARVGAVRGPLTSLLALLRDPTTAKEAVQAQAQALLARLSEGSTLDLLRDPSSLTRTVMSEVRLRKQRACYPYGIEGLDRFADGSWRMIPGCAPGKVTVITAVPGSGKSTVAARIALAQAAQGRRVLYGAWEMEDAPTLELLANMSLGWSRYKMSTASYTDEEMAQLEAECDRLGESIRFMGAPGFFEGSGALARAKSRYDSNQNNNDRNLDLIHACISEIGAGVFIGDLWKRSLKDIDPDDEEQALIRQQKIASRTRCHCVLLQQQRHKDVEMRADKRPTRDGIKGSGAWTEVADTILGVYRPALHKQVDDVTLEIDVLKQRWGKWPLAIEFDWAPEFGSMSNGREVQFDQPGPDFKRPSGFLDEEDKKRPKSKAKGSQAKGGQKGARSG